MLFAAKLPVFVEVALDLPRGALGFQIAPRRGEGQESLVIAEQDSLAAFEFALRRYAAGKPFQAARYGFLAALDNLGHAILHRPEERRVGKECVIRLALGGRVTLKQKRKQIITYTQHKQDTNP